MGYHKREIEKGIIGEFSKIKEEFLELEDSHQQQNKIMFLCELSDLFGAIELYLENNFHNITLDDIIQMKNSTREAFKDGTRKN